MWVIFILVIVGIVLFNFANDLNKDNYDLQHQNVHEKFATITGALNAFAFNGKGSVIPLDKRSYNLYEDGKNQIINFNYSTGHLTITWKYKYFHCPAWSFASKNFCPRFWENGCRLGWDVIGCDRMGWGGVGWRGNRGKGRPRTTPDQHHSTYFSTQSLKAWSTSARSVDILVSFTLSSSISMSVRARACGGGCVGVRVRVGVGVHVYARACVWSCFWICRGKSPYLWGSPQERPKTPPPEVIIVWGTGEEVSTFTSRMGLGSRRAYKSWPATTV